jgi:hypothetical protein
MECLNFDVIVMKLIVSRIIYVMYYKRSIMKWDGKSFPAYLIIEWHTIAYHTQLFCYSIPGAYCSGSNLPK